MTSGYGAGLVFVIGGWRADIMMAHGLQLAEIYDHSQILPNPGFQGGNGTQGVFTPIGQTMFNSRHGHTATILSNQKILIVGGYTSYTTYGAFATVSRTAELMDPFGMGHNINAPFSGIDLTARFDWTRDVQGNQTVVPNLFTGISEHSSTTLLDGNVLIAGGVDFIPPPINMAICSGGSYIYAP
jgi:hypothetical protein